MTHQGNLVVDAVSHAYNFSEENPINEGGRGFRQAAFQLSRALQTPEYFMDEKQYLKDHEVEEIERVLFLESDVDFTIHHSLPLTDYFEDGLLGTEKSIELRERNPNRVAIYEAINPLSDDVLDRMEYIANELEADGIKIYPARFDDGNSLRVALNDTNGREILDKAVELGIENVGVHKSVPVGPTPNEFYKVDDVDEIAGQYPELNFEIVHAGLAFLEDTIWMVSKYPNVYANLEMTSGYAVSAPRQFARVLGEMLKWTGPDHINFATGCIFTHPQPVIDAIWNFEFPEDMRAGYGYPELTDEVKRKILGENALRMLGKDPEQVRSDIEGDKWEQARAQRDEHPEPWSSISATGGTL
jgi:predicted TIM-barrel fold metal-dependent hydrolase